MLTPVLLFLLVTGTGWAGLGAITDVCRERRVPISLVQPGSATLMLLFAGWAGLFFGPPLTCGVLVQFAFMVGTGICNYLMLNRVQAAMQNTAPGVAWAFTQSAMIVPFLMGLAVFSEPLTLLRGAGVLTVLLALAVFALDKGLSGKLTGLRAMVEAFLLGGAAQCLSSLPSYFPLDGMTGLRRFLGLQTGIFLACLVDRIAGRRREPVTRLAVRYAVLFGGLNLIALLAFYQALNGLAAMRCGGLGYPAAQGLSIGIFFLWGCRRSRPSKTAWIAWLLCLAGIILLAAGAKNP